MKDLCRYCTLLRIALSVKSAPIFWTLLTDMLGHILLISNRNIIPTKGGRTMAAYLRHLSVEYSNLVMFEREK